MKKKEIVVVCVAIAAAIAIGFLLAGMKAVPELLVTTSSGRILAELPLPDGGFDHVFVHSVHRSEVRERFWIEMKDGEPVLRLYELRYQDQGVGMPTETEGGYRLEKGTFILAMDRRFNKIPIYISIVPGHGVVANGAYLPFRNWARPEDLVVLTGRMKRISRFGR